MAYTSWRTVCNIPLSIPSFVPAWTRNNIHQSGAESQCESTYSLLISIFCQHNTSANVFESNGNFVSPFLSAPFELAMYCLICAHTYINIMSTEFMLLLVQFISLAFSPAKWKFLAFILAILILVSRTSLDSCFVF